MSNRELIEKLRRNPRGVMFELEHECADALEKAEAELAAIKAAQPEPMSEERKLWLWKNFVDGRQEYWAFDNLYPCHANGDPQTLGEPCGYAIVKPSINGRAAAPKEAR